MKINLKNSEKIEEAIEKEEEMAHARCLSTYDLDRETTKAESALDNLHIPKKSRKGTLVMMTGGSVGSSYKYEAYSTWATCERGSKDWFLISVRRDISPSETGLGNKSWMELPITYDELGKIIAKNIGRLQCKEK